MKTSIKPISIILTLLLVCSSCAQWSKTAKGGAIGAGVGAAVGAAAGSRGGNTVKGAILGAAVGGVAGAAIGRYMDRQKRKLEEDLGKDAEIERVGEGIQITFNSGLLFDVNSSELRSASRENIRKMVTTLEEYPDTEVLIEGHTDSSGADSYNQSLSVKRADAVSSYARSVGMSSGRLIVKGYGESQPVASNDSESGRQKNRRVEIAIYANDKLKEKAQKGQL